MIGRYLVVSLVLVASVLSPTSTPLSQTCAEPPAGMVSWWGGEQNADDYTGANHGILEGSISFVPGMVGFAFHFDSNDDRIRIPHSSSMNQTNEITVDFWMKAPFQSLDPFVVVDKSHGGGDGSGWVFQGSGTNGQLGFIIGTGTGQPGCVPDTPFFFGIFTAANVTDDLWHHIAGTFDGQKLRIYVDGQLSNERTLSGPVTIEPNTRPLNVGWWNGGAGCSGSGRFFRGSIDELELFDRALSQPEIQAIFDAGSVGKCPVATEQTTWGRVKALFASAE